MKGTIFGIGLAIGVIAATGVSAAPAFQLPTSVSLSVCGDSVVQTPAEVCDTGTNTGAYSLSITGRNCKSGCKDGYGQYCGDLILQPLQGEECDDGNNTDGDRCSGICKIEQSISEGCCPGLGPGGGGSGSFVPGGSTELPPTKVAIYGKAYPDASVHILKDGTAVGVVKADSKADFFFATTDVSAGIATFGFWAEDRNSLKSIAYTLTFRIVPNAVTTVTGAFLPPTITSDKRVVGRGEVITFFGQSAPVVQIFAEVNSEHTVTATTTTDDAGDWNLPFDSAPLEDNALHTARAQFQIPSATTVLESSFSETVGFFVGTGEAIDFCGRSDINQDGRVNFVDFSILIFFWGSADVASDINLDGRVNIVDFSIMLTCWNG